MNNFAVGVVKGHGAASGKNFDARFPTVQYNANALLKRLGIDL